MDEYYAVDLARALTRHVHNEDATLFYEAISGDKYAEDSPIATLGQFAPYLLKDGPSALRKNLEHCFRETLRCYGATAQILLEQFETEKREYEAKITQNREKVTEAKNYTQLIILIRAAEDFPARMLNAGQDARLDDHIYDDWEDCLRPLREAIQEFEAQIAYMRSAIGEMNKVLREQSRLDTALKSLNLSRLSLWAKVALWVTGLAVTTGVGALIFRSIFK
ncbi:MAG: hypothetical protein ABJL17_06845 [Parvibaculum sp.]|uniref:hypothetical protein n=1 Tax=Parvibaculum sp. TaxID=2024848 RepID=UPI003264D4A5